MRALPRVLLVLIGVAGCSSGSAPREPAAEPTSNPSVDDYVESLPKLSVPDYKVKTELPCDGKCPADEQVNDYFCSYSRYEETALYDRFVALQPNSATLWPGTVVRGADASNGILTPVGVPLAPVTFSFSLENIAGSPVATMDSPSLSSFREARNEILGAGVTGATPAALHFEVRKVSNESQLAVALGASAKWPGGPDIAASFDFNSSSLKTKILVNFTQSYYTIDVDTPSTPSRFFAPGTNVDELQKWMSVTSPPMYVQSITYGRRVVLSIQTDSSAEDMKEALEAAYAGIGAGGQAKVSGQHKRILSDSTIRAFILGGSGEDAAAVIDGIDSLGVYIKKGGSYSPDSPGAPIAYKLAYLDNDITKLAFATDYAERKCVRNRIDMRVSFDKIKHIGGDDWGDNAEIFGSITVRYPTADSPVIDCSSGGQVKTVWSVPSGSWITVKENYDFTPIHGAYVTLNDVAVAANAKICLSASLREEDGDTGEWFGSESYGDTTRLIEFKDGWIGEHMLVTHGSNDNSVGASIRIDEGLTD